MVLENAFFRSFSLLGHLTTEGRKTGKRFAGTSFDIDHPPDPAVFQAKNPLEFMVYQKEMCPETHRPHYQCYFEFQELTRSSTLAKRYKNIRWSLAVKDKEHNVAYCTKKTDWTTGELAQLAPPVFFPPEEEAPPTAAEKKKKTKEPSALSKLAAEIVQGNVSIKEIAMKYPTQFIMHERGIRSLKYELTKHREEKTEVIAFYGMPQSGKTRLAHSYALERFPKEEIWSYSALAPNAQEWWQGYAGQRCVIINEMSGHTFYYHRTLDILDRYDIDVPYKGGSVAFTPELIILTSNFPPSEWYHTLDAVQTEALLRRITKTYKFVELIDAAGKPIYDEEYNLQYATILDEDQMCMPTTKEQSDRLHELNKNNKFQKRIMLGEEVRFPAVLKIVEGEEYTGALEFYDESSQ